MNFPSDKLSKLEQLVSRLPEKLGSLIKDFLDDPSNYQTLGLWTSAVVAALVSVGYAKLFLLAEEGFHHLLRNDPYVALALSPLLFLAAWWLIRRFSPEAAGSGIPQIMAANELEYVGENRKVVDRLLSLRTAGVKVLSSFLVVLGGGAVGREGPTLQICASIFHFFGMQVRKFAHHTSEHVWVVAGSAAGLASAFNTPLGGIVYAIEELGLVHFHKIRTALISGVIVSGLVAQWILGSYLYLGFPKLVPVAFSFMPIVVLNGILAGLAGALFGKSLIYLVKKRSSIKRVSRLALISAACGLVMAAAALYSPNAAGPGTGLINSLLFQGEVADPITVLLRFSGTLVSYISGAAGGIFSPSLAIGASLGSYLSQFIGSEHGNLMILLGMIAFLTGVTRTPFTSFILVLEMTDRHSAIFPMMLAALAAHWTANFIDKSSCYEHLKAQYLPPSSVKESPKT